MKRKHIYRLFTALALLAATACALEGPDEAPDGNRQRIVRLQLDAGGTVPLKTTLAVFRRAAGSSDEYTFDRSLAVADGQRLKLTLAELTASDYRFLSVAQSDDFLTLADAAGNTPGAGTPWSGIRLLCPTGQAGIDCYTGITDRTGKQLLDEGTLHLTLTRIVGQTVFDFYRIGTSVADPQSIVSTDVVSVLDRVKRIDIAYAEPTTSVRFDAAGNPLPDARAAEPFVQTIEPALTGFGVALPQADKGLTPYDEAVRGSVRIAGACLLPSDDRLRVKITFTYYDTTPACNNDHTGDHTATCFEERTLTLNLPAANAPQGLPVVEDSFTVSRAGIRTDRIIDISVQQGVAFDFTWFH